MLAKHAQHVVLIHFPLALFVAAVAFDYLAQWTRNQALAAAAYFNLLLAALSTVPASPRDLPPGSGRWRENRSRAFCCCTWSWAAARAVLIWLVSWIHWRARRRPAARLPNYRLPIEIVGALLVALTGHLGGFLSGVNAP